MTRSFEVVIVAYRSRDLVEKVLAGLEPGIPVAVVDNFQGADGLEEVVVARDGARYLVGPNRGFAAAANLGARTSEHPVMVILNPDCAATGDDIRALVAATDADPTLATCSAISLEDDGRSELGIGGWEPSVRRTLVHVLGLHKIWPEAGLWARAEANRPIELDYVGGSCKAMPLDHFFALGGFDERYFVYSEDVEFGRAARTAGLRTVLRTDVIIPTLARTSGDSSTRMLRVRGQSMMSYLRRHHPRPRIEAIRLLLTAGALARGVRCRLLGRHHEAAEHRAYVVGLWRGAEQATQ